MAATTNHNTGTAGEGTVAMSAADRYAIEFAARKGWGPSRTLAALGHPGYGRAFAARVLATMAATGCSSHQAVYGR
jgi:hypothetical protein